jgi:hypothetical protein
VNFEWLTDQLQLLIDFKSMIEFHDVTCCSDPELGDSVIEGLGTDDTSILWSEISIEDCNTEIMLWGIFCISQSAIEVFSAVYRKGLESSPTNRENQRIV